MCCPCKDCSERWQEIINDKVINCHAHCKRYITYKEEVMRNRNKKIQENEAYGFYKSVKRNLR